MNEILKDLVVFGAKWCKNCDAVKQFLDSQGTEYVYVDVDTAAGKAMADEYNIRNLPWGQYQGRRAFTSPASCRMWLRDKAKQNMPEIGGIPDFDPSKYASEDEMMDAHREYQASLAGRYEQYGKHDQAVADFKDAEAVRQGLPPHQVQPVGGGIPPGIADLLAAARRPRAPQAPEIRRQEARPAARFFQQAEPIRMDMALMDELQNEPVPGVRVGIRMDQGVV